MSGLRMGDPDNLCSALARQKWIILTSMLLALAGAIVAVFYLPARYQASARVLVDQKRYTAPALATEAEMMRSNAMIEAVIRDLHLQSDIELTGKEVKINDGKFLSLSLGQDQALSPEIIENFRKNLDVQTVIGSYVLVVSYTSFDAEKAARIVNALSEKYIDSTRRPAPVKAPRKALPKVTYADIEGMKQKLEEDEARLQALRNNNDGALNQLKTERDSLSKRYGPKHPRMIALEKQIAGLEEGSGNDAPEVQKLRTDIDEQKKAISDVMNAGKPAPVMPSPPAMEDGAKIVSPALVPTEAVRHVPSWLYAASPFAGLLLGLLLAGINEQLDRGVKTAGRYEVLTGLPLAASIRIPKTKDSGAAYVLQKPSSPVAEAIRTLRTSLKLIGDKQGRQVKIVTVTSPQDTEPRALISTWLARLAARSGEKVLLIDADFRNPQLHAILNRSNTPSLVDYLTGQNYLEQIIWKQDPSGAHVIFASPVPNTALDLIGSEKMKKLSNYLRQGYDLVVLCAPPCLSSADASLLANESDHTLYIADARTTSRTDIVKGMKVFQGFGYTALSPVLTEAIKA